MDVAGINNGLLGMALFDMWDAAVKKTHGTQKSQGSPLVAAAAKAFDAYIQTAEIGMAAQISQVGGNLGIYALNPGGQSAKPITSQDIAPFLALNIMA
jgi:hypothetical protein